MKKLYVCENCGCVHEDKDEVFNVLGVEMCTECAPAVPIVVPECGFGCQHCYDTCPLFQESLVWNF